MRLPYSGSILRGEIFEVFFAFETQIFVGRFAFNDRTVPRPQNTQLNAYMYASTLNFARNCVEHKNFSEILKIIPAIYGMYFWYIPRFT